MRQLIIRSIAIGLVGLLVPMIASAETVTLYSTSFEASQGFTLGELNGQQTWETSPGAGFATVVDNAPAIIPGSRVLRVQSGTDANADFRFAFPAGFSPAWTNAVGTNTASLVSFVEMYLPSGQQTPAVLGAEVYDDTFDKILVGFLVNADTGEVFLEGYYDNAGAVDNYLFPTGQFLGFDEWVQVGMVWNSSTGAFSVAWKDQLITQIGAGAGSLPRELDLVADRNGSTLSSIAFFDNVEVLAVPVPEPGTIVPVAFGLAIAVRLGSRPTRLRVFGR